MKLERSFKLTGVLESIAKESFGDLVVTSAIVYNVINDKRQEYKISLWNEELKNAAYSCIGKNVLVLGRLISKKGKADILNVFLHADDIFVEPSASEPKNERKVYEPDDTDIPF